MSQSRANLASARRELAERRDEAAQCMAELKAAQDIMASKGSGPKVLTVTVQEVFGAIAVDRVAVRPDMAPAQEKVMAEGIPCKFALAAGVDKFDLVLMAEHSPASPETTPEHERASVADSSSGAATGTIPPVAASDADAAAVVAAAEGDAVAAAAMAAMAEAQEVGGVPAESAGEAVTSPDGATETVDAEVDSDAAEPEAADKPEEAAAVAGEGEGASVPALGTEIETAVEEPKNVEGEEDAMAEAAGAEATAEETVTGAVAAPVEADGDGALPSTAVENSEAEAVTGEGSSTGGDGGEVVEATVAAAVADVAVPPPAAAEIAEAETEVAAEKLGCSTITTEVVVPSSELNFQSSQGQWRYLEADSAPLDGDDAVEVTKGVRFCTSLDDEGGGEAEVRILELSDKYAEADFRVRAAETMVKCLQPAPSGPSSRKKSTGGTGGRKSAMKKKGGTRAIKSYSGKGKSAAGVVSAAFGKACGKAKQAGVFAWGARNLVFFVSAVAVIHLHGDYLAV